MGGIRGSTTGTSKPGQKPNRKKYTTRMKKKGKGKKGEGHRRT